MIRAETLTRKFGDLLAVDGADFQVPEGTITGFVGPNGSGKSTVLRMTCGLVRPTSGRILVAGLDPTKASLAVRRSLSYLPGETSLYLHMRGREYLEFAGHYRAKPDPELATKLPRLFELPLDRKIGTYSGGMKQKLALTAVLTANVPLHLLDEPTRTLDATMRAQFLAAIDLLRERGRTIFLSSHHLADIEQISDRIIFLLQGRVIPTPRIDALREELAGIVRVKTNPDTKVSDLDLPADCTWEERHGMLRIHPAGDPRKLVAHLTTKAVTGIFWGKAELEEIYRLLYLANTEEQAP